MESKTVQGFTLVELVVVIIVLSILSAIAIPRFINLTSKSETAATNGIAAALAAASAGNYAVRSQNSTAGVAINNCQTIGKLLPGGLPSNYVITSQALGNNVSSACTLTGFGSVATTFIGTGIS